MTTGRRVNASPLCRHPLDLFASGYDAWDHLIRHVLDAREADGWGVLIPALRAVLDEGRRAPLHAAARDGDPSRVPPDLAAIWPAFLALVQAAVEQGASLGWYWEEEQPGTEGPYRTFCPSGILAYLDEDVVRTGFLPCRDGPLSGSTDLDRRYQLFVKCWRKARFKYQRAAQQRRLGRAPAALQTLMSKVPDRAAWEKLR